MSHRAKSGKYGACSSTGVRSSAKYRFTDSALWAGALSWCKIHELFFHNSGHFLQTRSRSVAKTNNWRHPMHRLPLCFNIVLKSPRFVANLAVGKSRFRLLDGQRRAQLSALPKVEGMACFRVITRHDYLQAHLLKIGLADSPLCPLCNFGPMTGEHLSYCPALLHVLSQDNCGALLTVRAKSILYSTARRFMSEKALAGVN
ncbi:hypothetical protein TNCV_2729561 [Trichonephila clavipes]|nr:hypothetical protein TNCV_2729561 [Trichonephila clavipes]